MYSKSLTHTVKALERCHILLTMLKYGSIYFELYVPNVNTKYKYMYHNNVPLKCIITMYHNIPHYNVLSPTNPVYLTADQSA